MTFSYVKQNNSENDKYTIVCLSSFDAKIKNDGTIGLFQKDTDKSLRDNYDITIFKDMHIIENGQFEEVFDKPIKDNYDFLEQAVNKMMQTEKNNWKTENGIFLNVPESFNALKRDYIKQETIREQEELEGDFER